MSFMAENLLSVAHLFIGSAVAHLFIELEYLFCNIGKCLIRKNICYILYSTLWKIFSFFFSTAVALKVGVISAARVASVSIC